MAGALLRFGAIVLAAGLSRRMGGPNKLLQPYRGQPLLAHALESAAKAGLASRVVVTGRDPAEIEALAALYGFRCVHNARFAEGLGASIAAGASAADASLAGVFIALGDMPEVLADDYRLLASRFAHGAIAAPVYKGARGHPVLFCASYLDELSALRGEEGARSILKRRAARFIEVETDNRGVLRDFDTPDDFKAS
jgi:CTP:molybdopterin cytidylyltransferase MocA